MLRALDKVKSTYSASFGKVCKDVFAARAEANDNVRYLQPLRPWLEKLEFDDSFADTVRVRCMRCGRVMHSVCMGRCAHTIAWGLWCCASPLVQCFRPIMHCVLNVWKFSRYFNTPTRLVILIREICNCLIVRANQSVSTTALFDLISAEEAHVAVTNLQTVLKVCRCGHQSLAGSCACCVPARRICISRCACRRDQVCGMWKSTYFDYKAVAAVECCENPWRVQNSALFGRLDRFLERCHDVREFTQVHRRAYERGCSSVTHFTPCVVGHCVCCADGHGLWAVGTDRDRRHKGQGANDVGAADLCGLPERRRRYQGLRHRFDERGGTGV